ncbi:MAG: hypothetical protein RLZZ15_4541 [Verrucomicrobiota bacterium]|jgi:GNAT superfamily N-acetyltransferase
MNPAPARLAVREIDLADARAVARFIGFPFRLYRGVPQWTPPLRLEMAELMDPRKNGFFDHSTAGFFLAERDGETVGRIAALRQRFYNEAHQNDTAFFYWFEAVDDEGVARALLAAAEAWARARGLRRMIGPIGFTQPDPPGILVRGFEHEGTMNVPWHFPYYERLLLAAGAEPHTDYLSGYLDCRAAPPPELIAHGRAALARGGYAIKGFASRAELRAWAGRFFPIYLAAFESVPDFFAMSPREFNALMDRMLLVADPAAIKLLLAGDEVLGFLLSFQDLTPGLRRSGGRLLPFGWWHLWRSRARSRQLNIIALGVLPEKQKGGANLALIAELLATLQRSRYARAEIVQIVGGNMNTHGDMTRLGARWDKCHRVFGREFARPAP